MGCSELWCGCHSKTVVTLGYVWPCWGRLLLQSRLFWHLFRNDEKRRGRWAHDEMKSNGHWNSKNPKDLAVFGLVPALAIFGPCQPLEVWIRRLFIERHLLLPYVFDKMASRFQIFQSETLLGTGRETFVVVVSHLLFPSWCRAGRSITCREFRLSSPIGNVPFWCSVTARNKHKKCVYPILCGGPYKSCVIECVWRRLAAETHVQANRVRPLAVLLRAASCVGLISPCGCFHFCVTKETGENQRDTTNSRLLLVFLFLLPYSLPSVNSGRIWLFISWIHFFLNR